MFSKWLFYVQEGRERMAFCIRWRNAASWPSWCFLITSQIAGETPFVSQVARAILYPPPLSCVCVEVREWGWEKGRRCKIKCASAWEHPLQSRWDVFIFLILLPASRLPLEQFDVEEEPRPDIELDSSEEDNAPSSPRCSIWWLDLHVKHIQMWE